LKIIDEEKMESGKSLAAIEPRLRAPITTSNKSRFQSTNDNLLSSAFHVQPQQIHRKTMLTKYSSSWFLRVDGQTNQRAALGLKIIQISFNLLTPAVNHSSWKSGLPV